MKKIILSTLLIIGNVYGTSSIKSDYTQEVTTVEKSNFINFDSNTQVVGDKSFLLEWDDKGADKFYILVFETYDVDSGFFTTIPTTENSLRMFIPQETIGEELTFDIRSYKGNTFIGENRITTIVQEKVFGNAQPSNITSIDETTLINPKETITVKWDDKGADSYTLNVRDVLTDRYFFSQPKSTRELSQEIAIPRKSAGRELEYILRSYEGNKLVGVTTVTNTVQGADLPAIEKSDFINFSENTKLYAGQTITLRWENKGADEFNLFYSDRDAGEDIYLYFEEDHITDDFVTITIPSDAAGHEYIFNLSSRTNNNLSQMHIGSDEVLIIIQPDDNGSSES